MSSCRCLVGGDADFGAALFQPADRRASGPCPVRVLLQAACILVLASCAGFQGTQQLPLLRSIAGASARDAGPWLSPRFSPQPALVVSWLTARRMDTRLALGTDPEAMQELAGEPGVRLHRITLPDLEAGRAYHYAPNFNGNGCADDRVYVFTAPDWDAEQATILVVGDMQPRDDLTWRAGRIVAQGIAASSADLVIQLGDVAEIGALSSHWLDSLDNIRIFASRLPMGGVIGNHDYYGDPGRNFRALFPYDFADADGAWWSFTLAGAHFTMVDCFEQAGGISRAQKDWIEADLEAAVRRGSRYLFLFLHLTPITTGSSDTATELERWLIPLADRAGVDAPSSSGTTTTMSTGRWSTGGTGWSSNRTMIRPAEWCTTSAPAESGAYPEIDYGILERKPSAFKRRLYDLDTGTWLSPSYVRLPWDTERYIDHRDDPGYGQLLDGRHYYHLPPESSYQGDTDWLGYRYGEQTLHYLLIRLGPQGATVSAHYPGGDLLSGPQGDLAQRFRLPQGWDRRR